MLPLSAIRAFTFLVFASMLPAQSPLKSEDSRPFEKYSDTEVSFEMPKGAKVTPSESKGTYFISLPPAEDRICILMVQGGAESPEFSQKRAEASMKDAASKIGVETVDGEVKMICREVSKISRHSLDNGVVFAFQYKADMLHDGKIQRAGSVLGFGALDGKGVYFQISGLLREDDEKVLKAILNSVRSTSKE